MINTQIDPRAKLGKDVIVWHNTQIREFAEIGDGTKIGKNVYIDHGVKIGKDCKIQNNALIYHGVTLEDNVFIGPAVTFTNDLFPRANNDNWEVIKTLVCKGASIGAGAVILCGVRIGEKAMVGIGSVVTKHVPDRALVYGNPARIKGETDD